MENQEQAPQRRRGPKPLASVDKRTRCKSVRLNEAEEALVDRMRGKMQAGTFIRRAAMGNLPPIVPEINREAWEEAARIASNLNQIARKLNMGEDPLMVEVQQALYEFRRRLRGAGVS